MGITSISWATHTVNCVCGCSRPPAVTPEGLKIMNLLGIPVHPRWLLPNSSPECKNCYAEFDDHIRFHRSPYRWNEEHEEQNVRLLPDKMREFRKTPVLPVHLPPSKRERFFICSYGDIFHRLVPDSFLENLFTAMLASPHIYMLLTKRPERAAEWPGPWPDNIWLGTTCGHPMTKWRMEFLRRSAAKGRFVSMEPLLDSMLPLNLDGIHQVIVGGESGRSRRPFQMAWAREVRDTCVEQGSAFFFKQDSHFRSGHNPFLVEKDGNCLQYHQYPGELSDPVQVGGMDSEIETSAPFPILD
jgi:protein gp37